MKLRVFVLRVLVISLAVALTLPATGTGTAHDPESVSASFNDA